MTLASPVPEADVGVPMFVQGWIRSLLDPDLLAVLREAGDRNIEVRLVASRGRIRRRPALLLDAAGNTDMVDPGDVE